MKGVYRVLLNWILYRSLLILLLSVAYIRKNGLERLIPIIIHRVALLHSDRKYSIYFKLSK